MSALLDFSTGDVGIAITWNGETPWHGYGNRVPDGDDLDQWQIAAGLNWVVEERSVFFAERGNGHYPASDYKALLRSDNEYLLSIVSDRYKIVQPREVLDFYKDLIAQNDFRMHTAGSLANGKRIWALAKTGVNTRIMGQDEIEMYFLLATSFDGSMATICRPTSVCVVCQNTLSAAIAAGGRDAIKIPHSSTFNAMSVKGQLGLDKEAWELWQNEVNSLAETKITDAEAVSFFNKVLDGKGLTTDLDGEIIKASPTIQKMMLAFKKSPGAELRARKQTAWGLVNAVTFVNDHMTRGESLNSTWFGTGEQRKNKAWAEALKMAA